MRIFFPGLLLLVSLIVFVLSAWAVIEWVPHVWDYAFMDASYSRSNLRSKYQPTPLLFQLTAPLLNLLLSAWAAAWAWKEIQRVKMERME